MARLINYWTEYELKLYHKWEGEDPVSHPGKLSAKFQLGPDDGSFVWWNNSGKKLKWMYYNQSFHYSYNDGIATPWNWRDSIGNFKNGIFTLSLGKDGDIINFDNKFMIYIKKEYKNKIAA